LAQRACTARRNIRLLSSGLTLRDRAAPKPTAVRRMGEATAFYSKLQEIEGEIQQWFSSQAGLAHHCPQPSRAADTQPTHEFRSQHGGWICFADLPIH
jgi:hypothetical protein